jgi:hypothetical protein
MDASLPPAAMSGSRRSAMMTWGLTLLFNVVLPFVTYTVLTGNGMKTIPALTIIAAWPMVELVLYYALHHRVDEFGVLALIIFALGVVSALAFNSTRLAVVKDSAITGLLGVMFLASLVLARPMAFYMGRKFATDGSAERVAYWNGLWRYPSFRRSQRVVTVVWGLALLVEAGVRIALSYGLSTSTMVLVNAVLPAAATAALIVWTITYGKRVRNAAGVA